MRKNYKKELSSEEKEFTLIEARQKQEKIFSPFLILMRTLLPVLILALTKDLAMHLSSVCLQKSPYLLIIINRCIGLRLAAKVLKQ